MRIPDREWFRLIRTGWALGAGFLALSAFIAAAVIFSVQQQSNDAVVRQALQIEIAMTDVFSALQDAEIGQRGYLLTEDEAFLQPYRAAGHAIEKDLSALGRQIGRIEELQAPFVTLRSRISDKQAELAQTLSLFQAGRKDEALAIVRGGRGKAVMDDIRRVIDAMDQREDRVVENRQTTLSRTQTAVAVSTTAAVILLGVVALAAMREVRRRSALSRFLPAEVADRLATGDQSLRHGRELPASIVFVDIRDSTALAESLDASALSTILSDFRTEVLAAAEANGGLIDKFIGDGALVVFGVHDGSSRSAAQALAFARDLRARHQASGMRFRIGMGIHHGLVFCGIVGAAERLEFTVLGDAVNVAARLEKETKVHGVDLLASGAVIEHAGEGRDGWREVACDALRGRRATVALFVEHPAPA